MKKAKGKRYGKVTSLSFPDLIHIDGAPYDVKPVQRFLNKGGGIMLGDGVIFSASKEGKLSFLMNEKYAREHGYAISGGVVFVVDPSSHSQNEPASQDEIDELNRLERIAKEGEFVPLDQAARELGIKGEEIVGNAHLHITLDNGGVKKYGLECTISLGPGTYQFVKPSVVNCDTPEDAISSMIAYTDIIARNDPDVTGVMIGDYQHKVLEGYLGDETDATDKSPSEH